ncbi:MAG: hypothetical protein B7Z72_13340, partial [Gemmatimonadetes bacterium 21-71-4]
MDTPWLHGVAGEPNGDGIVDVFEYGASLSRIARPQPEPSLFFVPAGTLSADPVAMMANPRWRRLAAGFRHENAVMLLFLPPESIGAIAGELDALVAIAPDGAEAGLAATPEIQAAMDGGVRLVATVTDAGGIEAGEGGSTLAPAPRGGRPDSGAEEISLPVQATAVAAPPIETSPPPSPRRPHWRHLPQPSPRGRWVVLGFLVLAVAGAVAVSLVRLRPHPAPQGPRLPPASSSPARPAQAEAPPREAARAPDSLPFAVQVSAWTRFSQALANGDRLAARGFPSVIAPIKIRQRLWYRVYAGPAATR